MSNLTGRLEKEEKFYQSLEEKLQKLPKIFTEYYMYMRANRKSYTTIRAYTNNILHFANFLSDNQLSNEFYKNISAMDVEKYMISLETRRTKDGIRRTGDDILQTRWSSLNYFFSWLIKREYLTDNPITYIERPKNQTEHKVVYLTKVELNKLFKAISRNPNTVMAARDKMIVSLILATALRVSALVNINIEDIDMENKTINVIEKRHKVRSISFGEQTKQALQEWISIRNEVYANVDSTALFLSKKKNRLSSDSVGDILDKYCDEAGIKRITPHKLRSTAACTLAKAGIPVKAIAKQLGHNSTQTTMRYIDVFSEDTEKAIGILDGQVQ